MPHALLHDERGRRAEVPWWWAVLIPAVLYPGLVLCAAVPALRPIYVFMTRKEGGVEFFAVGVLLIGVVFGVTMLRRYRRNLPGRFKLIIWWYGLVIAAMFFLAGEELSWGQHLGFWGHEEAAKIVGAGNDQQETNLHNFGNALDQNPTNLVVLAAFLAYVVNPLILRFRQQTLEPDNPGYWFWPNWACLGAALGVLLIRWPERIYEFVAGEIPYEVVSLWRHSEIHETYIALLFSTYILSACFRLRAYRGSEGMAGRASFVDAEVVEKTSV